MKRLTREPYVVIYPHYLDSKRSRGAGRRVPSSIAVPFPTEQEMQSALERLDMKFEVQRGRAHPREGNRASYRVIVFDEGPKSRVVKKLAKSIGATRGQSKRTE